MASPSTSALSTTPVDVTGRRSCRRCTRRMSSLTLDKHTICVTCRDVDCSVAVRCNECREWSTELMNEYVRHKRSLISKSRKPKVTTPSASSASVTPSESPYLSQVVSPSPTSLADDGKLKNYVHSFLASMPSQQSGQVSLGSKPFVSAPSVEVPDLPSRGSTGGKTAESLSSRSVESPFGVVPPPPQDDVMPPTHVSASRMSSVGLAGVSGVPSPSLGVSDPFSGRRDQLRDRGDLGFTCHIVSADVHVPRSLSSFDPTSLLFPFSDSGFSSLSSLAPPPLSSFSISLSSSFSVASSSTVPIFSLPSVVPSVLSTTLPSAPPLPPSSSFSVGPPLGFSSSGSYPSSASFLASSAPSFPPTPLSTPLSSAPATSWGALPFSSTSSVPSSSDVRPVSSSSTSSPSLDFAAYQANVLGLLAEYQAFGRWYFASGGKDFLLIFPLIFHTCILTFVLTFLLARPAFSLCSPLLLLQCRCLRLLLPHTLSLLLCFRPLFLDPLPPFLRFLL